MPSYSATAVEDTPRLQGVIKDILLRTDSSAMERERIVALVCNQVMAMPLPTAPHVGAGAVTINTSVFLRATDDATP